MQVKFEMRVVCNNACEKFSVNRKHEDLLTRNLKRKERNPNRPTEYTKKILLPLIKFIVIYFH